MNIGSLLFWFSFLFNLSVALIYAATHYWTGVIVHTGLTIGVIVILTIYQEHYANTH